MSKRGNSVHLEQPVPMDYFVAVKCTEESLLMISRLSMGVVFERAHYPLEVGAPIPRPGMMTNTIRSHFCEVVIRRV